MADAETMRQWLKDHDYDVPERGRISADNRRLYLEHNPDEAFADGGVTEADFGELPGDEDPGAPVEAERQPRKPRAATTKTGGGGWWGRNKKPARGRKKARDRVPLEKFGTRTWDMLARFARPISPPTSICLELQAPQAGILLEDIFRETIVDRFLQPVARAEDAADKLIALGGPPMLVMAIDMAQRNPGLSDQEKEFRIGILGAMLEEALEISLDVTEKYAEQLIERRERKQRHQGEIAAMLALIFPPPPPPPADVIRGEVIHEAETVPA